MLQRLCILILTCQIFTVSLVIGQSSIQFDSFAGDVYELPYSSKNLPKGLAGFDYSFQKIGTVNWEVIDFKDDQYDNLLPGVIRKDRFAVILKSKMYVEHDGCYEFSLNSDDGSILWINEDEIINNDGSHKMTLKRDSVELKKGTYPIKIWYYQAYPDRRGFEFKNNIVGRHCNNSKILENAGSNRDIAGGATINISSEILFASGSSILKNEALNTLDHVVSQILNAETSRIEVIGHTDSDGDEDLNMRLSKQRAEAVQTYLLSKVKRLDLIFVTIAKGESEPLNNNETALEKQNNRRVEIKMR